MIWKPTFVKFTTILVVFIIIVQCVIILYNHFTGYLELSGIVVFMMRWLIGSLLSIMVLPFFSLPDMYMVSALNRKLAWESHKKTRFQGQRIPIDYTLDKLEPLLDPAIFSESIESLLSR